MTTEQKKQPESSQERSSAIGRIWRHPASNDDLFALLVPASFLALLVLAFFGKAAEMAVVAGFSAVCMAFLKLQEFSEFSGIGFSAKLRDVAQKVEAMAVKETEIDPEGNPEHQLGEFEVFEVSSQEREALQSIDDSKFTFRTATGVAQNLGVSVSSARQIMSGLEKKGLVAQIVTSRRSVAWNITAQGRNYLASIANGRFA